MMIMDLLHPLPRHMRSPGEEGYRTPTVEDAEHDLSTDAHGNLVYPPTGQALQEAHTSALESLASSPRMSIGMARKNNDNNNNKNKNDKNKANDVGSVDDTTTESSSIVNLTWKQRIRHFTWAYFTLTMATGGIANVLNAGQYSVETIIALCLVVVILTGCCI